MFRQVISCILCSSCTPQTPRLTRVAQEHSDFVSLCLLHVVLIGLIPTTAVAITLQTLPGQHIVDHPPAAHGAFPGSCCLLRFLRLAVVIIAFDRLQDLGADRPDYGLLLLHGWPWLRFL